MRRLALAYANARSSGFEWVHGMVDRIMAMLSVEQVGVGEAEGYYIRESNS